MSLRIIALALLSFLLLLMSHGLKGQETGIDGFAHFLYQSELYGMAAEEFERLHFDDPQELDYIFKLIECYRKSGKEDHVNTRFQDISFDNSSAYSQFYQVLFRSDMPTLMAAHYSQRKNSLTPQTQADTELRLAVLHRNWPKAQALSVKQLDGQSVKLEAEQSVKTEPKSTVESKVESKVKSKVPSPQLMAINKYIDQNYRRKNPVMAGVLSGVVPGLGRIYAKDTKDGIFSFIFVVSSGYQSYRRFKEKGTGNAGAWIYGGLSLGFYLGNIYGAYQSAKFYNKANDKKLFDFAYPQLLHSAYQP